MGHVMISNIGTLGIEIGYAPLCSPTYCQLVICFGAARKVPVYDETTDSIVAKQIITTIFTFDHRFGDAAVAAHTIKVASNFIEDPDNFDPTNFEDKVSVEEK
jgi:pyruvate/2-oxoglutarate dehydrogenase complex dihydrolipoamide acyltransferase (E2) component